MKQKLYVIIALLCAVVQGAWGQTTVNLSTITGDYTIPDGATVTGTSKDKKYMISIAAGATITLSGITIEQDGSETGYNYPVLTCKGDATIILAEGTTNKVKSSHLECPCIYVPRYHTLTIQGGGTLIADSRESQAAAIGGGKFLNCGNIVIDGGIIKAYGGNEAYWYDVQHEEHTFPVSAAAIGGGWDADCGTITITDNITSLYAKKGEGKENEHVFSIGSGRDGRCEGVFIGGQQLTFSGRNDNKGQVFDPEVTMHVCNKVHYDTNTNGHNIGTMESQGIIEVKTSTYPPKDDPFISVATCKLTRHGYSFVNWNTQADGKGTVYKPGDEISKWGSQGDEMTLYAQWMPNEDYFDQSDKGNSEGDPFEISTAEQLILLASRVNDPRTESHQVFSDKYFKVMNDISFSDVALDETGSNFTAIGNDDDIRYFGGHFDGNGHTISGIRIYKGGEDREDNYQGLFGYLAPGAEVKNVILTDANITGNTYVGGIVGLNDNGTVTNCHATSSVIIRAVANGAAYHGGIVGDNSGENAVVSDCFSAATLTIEGDLTNCSGYGGIIGYNYTYGGNTATVRNCIVAGATIPAYESQYGPTYGAVVGINEGTLLNNYYTACNVGSVANATEVGCSQYEGSELEQSDPDGAKPALLDNVDNTSAIAAIDALSKNITYSVCINGRTLYKDGTWNTLCLPFDLRDFTGTLLEDAEVRTLDISSFGNTGFDETTGTLTLDFIKIDEVFAGEPFIVRWGTPENPGGENIVNPVFHAVKVENVDIDQRGYKINQLVKFSGTFKPENIYTDLNYKLYLGADNKLYYPKNENFEVKAFRAYFELLGSLVAGTPASQVKAFVLNFGDENTTGILEVSKQSDKSDNWYSLDGIRLSKKPSKKGIYIHNGRKEVLK